MRNKRLAWIDALNIVACMGVLLLHCTNSPIHSFDGVININWFIGIFTHSFFLWPVNVFFMLSGYTLIDSNITCSGGVKLFYKRRLKRLLLPLVIWNTFYTCLSILRSEQPGNIEHIIQKYVFFEYNGFLWFFVPLILIYISLPFFSLFVVNAERRMLRLYLILGLLMGFIPPLDSEFSVRHTTYDIYLMGSRFLYFVVAGWYIGKYEISKHTRRLMYLATIASMIVMFAGTMWLMLRDSEHYKYFIAYTNIPCTITAMGVFTLFRYGDINALSKYWGISSETLARFSSLSLGIYLIQAFWFMVAAKFHLCDDAPILRFLIMYALCVSSVWAMKHIPFLKRIV